MTMGVLLPNLAPFLELTAASGGFYILGAGTSAGLIPLTAGLRAGVRKDFAAIGGYPAERAPRTSLFERVVVGYTLREWHSAEMALQHIPHSALDLAVQRQLARPIAASIPLQYLFLREIPGPSSFFSFNLDGLARAYLSGRHSVVEPHGAIDRELTESPLYWDVLEWATDLEPIRLRRKWLPGPEPAWMADTLPYLKSRRSLRIASGVALIGYSFGRHAKGLDDAESFEYVAEHLEANSCPVFVVSPDPFELAERIQERLSFRRVMPLALYWDAFTAATVLVSNAERRPRSWLSGQGLAVLERAYLRQLDLAA
jgi:hypothetical protein